MMTMMSVLLRSGLSTGRESLRMEKVSEVQLKGLVVSCIFGFFWFWFWSFDSHVSRREQKSSGWFLVGYQYQLVKSCVLLLSQLRLRDMMKGLE